MAMLALRLVQGRDGIYYCSNWTTPGNCHDMSFLSGLACAHAIGARYPFEDREATKDFHRLRDLMGILRPRGPHFIPDDAILLSAAALAPASLLTVLSIRAHTVQASALI